MIVNYPQTAFQSLCISMFLQYWCVIKNFGFSKKSLKMFELFKKNKMAFEDFKDAEKYIVKNWDEIYYWWHSKKIQEVRKLYLKIFLTLKKIGFINGQNLLQIKKSFKKICFHIVNKI